MASGIDTGKAERGADRSDRFWLPGSRLGRLIIGLNVLGLAIVIGGALVLNELRRGLVEARIDSLSTQGELIATIIDQAATVGEPEPSMDPTLASQVLRLLSNPKTQRARLFDRQGRLIADSYWVADRVDSRPLAPARPAVQPSPPPRPQRTDAQVQAGRKALEAEVGKALQGHHITGMRQADDRQRVVSVSIPIQHVQAILGVLTLEASDVDQIIARQRAALLPFILLSVAVTLLSSLLLNTLIAQPVRRLARAADRVRLSDSRSMSLPDLARRDDELGDLTRALQAMTHAQSERMGAIERFAADVAHEIKNPLTSLRSAVETLDLVTDPTARDRLMAILKQDVSRLDRLVTDISNASRLDAELAREAPRPFDLARLVSDIVQTYRPEDDGPRISFEWPEGFEPIMVLGREGPLAQVLRNLIDNARSFSPVDSPVRLKLVRSPRNEAILSVDDDGPGIPVENLETVFERFYTSRPRGSAFGGNSGLGLSIARQIVEAQGGTIQAENRPATDTAPSGARFLVRLPLAGSAT